MATPKKRIDDYHIIKKIEESNYAIIYKVRDSNKKNLVLKISRKKTDEYNELISREYQILSQFKHPNIVPVFDFNIAKDKRAFFTLGYISGKAINKYFKSFSKELISVLIQVIDGLSSFHNKGFIHCDLKPEHILYDPKEKRAVIIDFGFAGIPYQDAKLGGTFSYMAPEVVKGIGIDQRSDLYSLGVIIHELLSGEKPIDKYLPAKGIPEEINKTISHLISEEPAIRPSIPELHQIFIKYLKTDKFLSPPYKVKLPTTGFIENPEIVEKLSSTVGKAILINGDTGTGKTRLLKEIRFRYLTQNYSVMYYCSREKTSFNNSLQKFISGETHDISKKEDKFQIFEELTAELINFSKGKHVIIMVDDLELLSHYELALFRYIGYGICEKNILLIGTSKSKEMLRELGFEILTLNPFSAIDIKKLLEKTFFKITSAKGIRASFLTDFAHWLHIQSGGNPLFIEEILKTLYENEILFYKSNQWQIRMTLLNRTPMPSKIENLLQIRLNELGRNEKEILGVLSLTGFPLEPSIISSVLEIDVNIGIENLKTSGLLREEVTNKRRVVYISNQILIKLIEKNLSKNRKKLLSKELVKTIEVHLQKDKDYFPVLARLCEGIGNKEKSYRYSLLSARNAELIYDYNSAIKYYEFALQYEKNNLTKKYPETLIKIANINQTVGNNRIALDYYNKASKSKRKDLNHLIYSGMGRVYSVMGHYSKAVDFLRRAMSVTKSREKQDFIKIAIYSLSYLNQLEEVKVILNQSFMSSIKRSDTEKIAETMFYQSLYEWLKGNLEKGIEKAKDTLRFAKEHNLSKQFAYIENLISILYQQKGDLNQSQKYLKDAIKRFRELNLANAFTSSLNNLAYLSMSNGDFQNANKLLENVLIKAHQTNDREAKYSSLSNLGNINENLGKFINAINFYRRALMIKPDAPMSNYNLTMVFYKKGQIDKAKSHIEKKLKRKEEILYYFAKAMLDLVVGKIKQADVSLNRGLKLIDTRNPNIETIVYSLLAAMQFYNEIGKYRRSLDFSKKITELANSSSREHTISSAFIKINKFKLKQTGSLNLNKETNRLKEIGCIYDYAYLNRLKIESMINSGINPKETKYIGEQLNRTQEIFLSLGAELELNRVEKLQARLLPIVLKDYSKRTISLEYLETFSRLAELISLHLGDENFIQNTLDLIINTTNAERGALFVKTSKGMEFVAGRDIDRTTIKDARELSRSAIKEIEENKIIFSSNALSDPNFSMKNSVMLNKIRSLLCIPLLVSENVIGAIYLDSRISKGIFGSEDKDFLLTVSRILASVVEKSIVFRSITEENILLKSRMIEEIGAGYIIGKSTPMKKVYRLIESVSQANSPVLILGETGTGKGMLARLIHLKSKRKSNKFLTINCGTIPETLLESELFGHKRGSFTGAVSDKKGLLEEGESGTVFLDEITNTSLSFQGKLLEAIEEKKIRRIGETKTRKIDVRFLFATNKDLEIEVEESRFRKDLFYRINVFRIEVPPLRERVKDIPVLARFFLERYSREMNRDIKGFSPDSSKELKECQWPGNVRELQNVIERAVVLTKGGLITLQDLGFTGITKREILPLKELKRTAIIEALNLNKWNIKKAAKMLDVSRRTIERYIKEYNIRK